MSFVELFRRDRVKEATIAARHIFQVKEHGSELWLTYDRWLVCPFSMIKEASVDAITRMRELYVERESNDR